MNSTEFSELLKERKIIIADGATGTNLMLRGLERGATIEQWVIEHPDKIENLHKDFIKAGAEIILTATFGGSEIHLERSGLKEKFSRINRLAVHIAKEATKNTRVLVAGSIGPLGQMLKPLGTLEYKDAEIYYSNQAAALTSAGVDLIVIETQFDMNEAKAAINGVKSSSNEALVCSFSFDRGTKTMMGVSPSSFAKEVEDFELSAIGINCGKSLNDNFLALQELASTTEKPIWFKPNAGLPHLDASGAPTYNITPNQMAEKVGIWIEIGCRIIGGCCGTTPDHLKVIAEAVKTLR